MPAPEAIKYRAFLSYSHADSGWAKWVHKRLESFRIGKDLAGRATPLGPVPASLRPIFRDREDFSGGSSLNDATIAALDASAALIVLCSPIAATRPAVNEEVRLFRWRHPDRPVIPLILDGKPYSASATDECFPPALRFAIEPDGAVSDRPQVILGPDVRETGEGRELALAKLIAGLTGLDPNDIYRRAERERRRQARVRNSVMAVLAVLTVLASASALYAWQQLKTNEAFLDASLDRFTSLVNRAVGTAQSYSLPLPVTLGFLEEAEGMLGVMAKYGQDTPKLKYRRAIMLRAFADNYRDLGRTADWQRRIDEAQRLMGELARSDPNNTDWAFEQGLAHERAGDLLFAKGDLAGAMREYQARQDIISRLAKADEKNDAKYTQGLQRDLSVSYNKIGDVLVQQGNLPAALDSFKASLAIAERLAKADEKNDAKYTQELQRDLSVSYEKIGDVLVQQGNLPAALDSFKASLAIRERLAKADEKNAGWQRDLSVSYDRVGDVLVQQGNLPAALDSFKASLAIAERLAKADEKNAGWQRDLSVSYNKVGDVLVAQGNLPAALDSFKASLAIAERLAKADEKNAGWQRDLSVSHAKLANTYRTAGQLPQARDHLTTGRAIIARLTEQHPDWAEWKRDLAWFDGQLAALEK